MLLMSRENFYCVSPYTVRLKLMIEVQKTPIFILKFGKACGNFLVHATIIYGIVEGGLFYCFSYTVLNIVIQLFLNFQRDSCSQLIAVVNSPETMKYKCG